MRAGDHFNRSVVEQDTTVNLLYPSLQKYYVKKEPEQTDTVKTKIVNEIKDKEKAHLGVIKEVKRAPTRKIEKREGRKKMLESSIVLSDGSGCRMLNKEENNHFYKVPKQKIPFSYGSQRKASTKLNFRPKDNIFDILNQSGGAELPSEKLDFQTPEKGVRRSLAQSLIESEKHKYDTGLKLKSTTDEMKNLQAEYNHQLILQQIHKKKQALNYSQTKEMERGKQWQDKVTGELNDKKKVQDQEKETMKKELQREYN